MSGQSEHMGRPVAEAPPVDLRTRRVNLLEKSIVG